MASIGTPYNNLNLAIDLQDIFGSSDEIERFMHTIPIQKILLRQHLMTSKELYQETIRLAYNWKSQIDSVKTSVYMEKLHNASR